MKVTITDNDGLVLATFSTTEIRQEIVDENKRFNIKEALEPNEVKEQLCDEVRSEIQHHFMQDPDRHFGS